MRIQVRRWVVVLTLSLLWGFVSQAEAGTDEAGRCSALMLRGYEKGCLLYTSPSPRDATLSRMPSSA